MAESATRWTEDGVATELLACEAERRDRARFTEDWPALDLAAGYRIQAETLRRRVARGEVVTGLKAGPVRRAGHERLGVDGPLVAWLTDAMALADDQALPQHALIHPRIEPEIALVVRDRLEGPDLTPGQALAAVGAVRAGVEVVDSRYRDHRFTAGDAVADNLSSGAYRLGARALAPTHVDLGAETVEVLVDGMVERRGAVADALEGPAQALAVVANGLARRGLAVEPGWVVLTGGLCDPVYATPGSVVTCRFSTLGDVVLDCGRPD